MKKYLLISILVPFIFSSCDREPRADFFASRNLLDVGETVYFTNNSLDADHFEWDYGDGQFSSGFNASHIYTSPGIYTVILFAYSKNDRVDRAHTTIEVVVPTSLEITVLEYYQEYPVPDASIILYNTLDDWIDQVNGSPEGFTNQYGRVIFSNLETHRYYVDVWEEFHNNYLLAEEDVEFIETDLLYRNEMNYFLAYVDYVEPGLKSMSGREQSRKIVKMERVGERDYMEKTEQIRKIINQRKAEVEKNGNNTENVIMF